MSEKSQSSRPPTGTVAPPSRSVTSGGWPTRTSSATAVTASGAPGTSAEQSACRCVVWEPVLGPVVRGWPWAKQSLSMRMVATPAHVAPSQLAAGEAW